MKRLKTLNKRPRSTQSRSLARLSRQKQIRDKFWCPILTNQIQPMTQQIESLQKHFRLQTTQTQPSQALRIMPSRAISGNTTRWSKKGKVRQSECRAPKAMQIQSLWRKKSRRQNATKSTLARKSKLIRRNDRLSSNEFPSTRTKIS